MAVQETQTQVSAAMNRQLDRLRLAHSELCRIMDEPSINNAGDLGDVWRLLYAAMMSVNVAITCTDQALKKPE